jgi:hypothetical protein
MMKSEGRQAFNAGEAKKMAWTPENQNKFKDWVQ